MNQHGLIVYMKKSLRYIILAVLFSPLILEAGVNPIPELKNMNPSTSPELKSLRNDIRREIFVIKSSRPERELPELKFYAYTVKKGDTFWSILAKSSLDIDTLVSVNGLSTARDISPGKKIYIPNMRGIVVVGDSEGKAIPRILSENKIRPEYVSHINRCDGFNKKYLFIPCGKISSLERSLFIGTGFSYPVQTQAYRKGRRTSGFGMRRNPFNSHAVEFHAGVDVSCPRGSEVLAARDGTVIYSGFTEGYGNLVVLQHEFGYRSFYGHLTRSKVKPGDTVKRGAVIALSGNTGRTTGPHLHFEVRRGKTPVPPGILLRG